MTSPAVVLRGRIAERSARVGVVGLGYVGLPTAVALAEAGFKVVGIDVDHERCSTVARGQSHVEDVDGGDVSRLVSEGRLSAVTRHLEAGDLDVVDLCVPTPLDKSGAPDVSNIVAATEDVCEALRPGQLIVLTSTSYPGTTAELVRPLLESRDVRVGEDVFLAFAPERIDPGNRAFGIRNTPRVVGGVTPTCSALARAFLETIVDRIIQVSSPEAAEMTKLLENTFRSVNIALANEIAIMCRRLGINVWEVIDSAATKPHGFMPFLPGPGLGGHCIPVDPGYLAWKLHRLNYSARFIPLATEINSRMPEYVVERSAEVLNDSCRSVRGSRVLLIGVSYKADIGDLRQSPALDVLALLQERGAHVCFADPFVPSVWLGDAHLDAVELTPDRLARTDLVVITTAHTCIDWEMIHEHARAVLDTRGKGRANGWDDWQTL